MTEEDKFVDGIRQRIAEQLCVGPEAVHDGASFVANLGCDSLDLIELVMALEDEYAVELPDREVETLVTVGQAIEYARKVHAAHGRPE